MKQKGTVGLGRDLSDPPPLESSIFALHQSPQALDNSLSVVKGACHIDCTFIETIH